jgi:iron complex outermembrane recepter protein
VVKNKFWCLYAIWTIAIGCLAIESRAGAAENRLPATNRRDAIAQSATTDEPIPISNVKVTPSQQGINVVLETAPGVSLSRFVNRTEGNVAIVEIEGARLVAGRDAKFVAPAGGIAEVLVTQVTPTSVRVTIAGRDGVPSAQVVTDAGGMTIASTPSTTTGQTSEEEQEIEVTVIATRTRASLKDIPQSVQIVPSNIIREQQANVYSALRNVASIRQNNPSNFASVRLTNRGFQINDFFGNSLRDGIRDTGLTIGGELNGIERIEVLQGPASVLYGTGSPGGTINFVSKQPLATRLQSFDVGVGSYDYFRGAVDLSVPVEPDGRARYRLNAAYKNAGSSLDFFKSRVVGVAPIMSFDLGDRAKLTVKADYVSTNIDRVDFGLPLIGTVLPNPNGKIPRNRNINEGFFTDSAFRAGYNLEYNISDNLSVRNAFQFGDVNYRNRGATIATGLLPDNRTLQRSYSEISEQLYDEYSFVTDATAKFATGSIQHELLVGADFRKAIQDNFSINRAGASIDLFNPIYGQAPGTAITQRIDSNVLTNQFGLYVQDRVSLTNNWKLLLGARFDKIDQSTNNRIAATTINQSDTAFIPRVGIVYQPTTATSFYASYSQSFAPATGRTFDNSALRPESGTQYEVGVKTNLTDRLSATLALYDLTRANVPTSDLRPGVTPGLGFIIQSGEQRSQGAELTLTGQISPGWNVSANYAYTDVRITRDNVLPIGASLNGVANHAASLWTTYEIPQGDLQGLGFGLGLFYVGERSGFSATPAYRLPSHLTADAAIFYKRNDFRAGLNFKNIFNTEYFESSFSNLRVSYGAPLTVQGTLGWEF